MNGLPRPLMKTPGMTGCWAGFKHSIGLIVYPTVIPPI